MGTAKDGNGGGGNEKEGNDMSEERETRLRREQWSAINYSLFYLLWSEVLEMEGSKGKAVWSGW
jgi:hypothetical protein